MKGVKLKPLNFNDKTVSTDGVPFALPHNIKETLEYEYVALNNNLHKFR